MADPDLMKSASEDTKGDAVKEGKDSTLGVSPIETSTEATATISEAGTPPAVPEPEPRAATPPVVEQSPSASAEQEATPASTPVSETGGDAAPPPAVVENEAAAIETPTAMETPTEEPSPSNATTNADEPLPTTTTKPASPVTPERIEVANPAHSQQPHIIIVDGNDAAMGAPPVAPTPAQEPGATTPLPDAVARTQSGDPSRQVQGASTGNATAPPSMQNQSDDDDLDEYIKSPNGQNAIIERSPGGRYVRFMEKLGSGASKDVYRAYDTQEGIEVAWNVVSLSGVPKTERNRIVNEVRLLERLHHHNIISFHGSWVNRERQEVHFVTEILSSGTLKSFINKVQVIRWKIAKRWATQILKGLEYLHTQEPPIIHRDLKCENIFINGTSGDLRIGDLGLSTVHRNGRVLSVLGTPEFMAPDMYEDSSYDEKVDIYAFGMCMLEIFTKEIPYKECKNPAQIYKKVSSGELPEVLPRLQSKNARDFIMLCLGYKDENGVYIRPTAKELLTHEFLVKRTNDEDEVMVDQPLIKRTIAENEPASYGNSNWATPAPAPTPSQPQSQSQVSMGNKSSTHTEKVSNAGPAPAAAAHKEDQGSADGDESDRFDEMPDTEVNIRKVKVLMGRGQELKEDEEPIVDSSAKSVESTPSRSDSFDKAADQNQPITPVAKNGMHTSRTGRRVNVGPTLQVAQPGHYLVAAAVIESEAAQSYPDDILKLVVTLPVEGQTQNVQFDFHLVEDDPVQVGKEMVAELGIPQGAILEISETISGLACAARMQRDKHKLRQGQMPSQQQQQMQPSQQMGGGPQDMQPGTPMQQQSGTQPDYNGNQQQQQRHPQQGAPGSDQFQMQQQQQQQQPQQQLSQPNQIPSDAQSQPPPYSHMQNQNHPAQHQMPGQLGNQQMNQGNQSQHFGYDPNANGQQHPQLQPPPHQQQQHGNGLPLDSQSVPGYVYDGNRNQMQNDAASLQPLPMSKNTSYGYDLGQAQNQGQQQAMQPQHNFQQGGLPGDAQNQASVFRYDSQQQQQQQAQMNQSGQSMNHVAQHDSQHQHQQQGHVNQQQTNMQLAQHDSQHQQQQGQGQMNQPMGQQANMQLAQHDSQHQLQQGQMNQPLGQQQSNMQYPQHNSQHQHQQGPMNQPLGQQQVSPQVSQHDSQHQLQQGQMNQPSGQQQQATVQFAQLNSQQQQQQQQQQGQMNQPLGQQQANTNLGHQSNHVIQQQPSHPNAGQQPQYQGMNQNQQQNSQQNANNGHPQNAPMQTQPSQGGPQGPPQTMGQASNYNPNQQAQGMQQMHMQPQQQQQSQYPSSPVHQQSNADMTYQHGVSLPTAELQRAGIPTNAAAMKRSRSVSTSSQVLAMQQMTPPIPAQPPAGAGSNQGTPSVRRLPPSRTSSGSAAFPLPPRSNVGAPGQPMNDGSSNSSQAEAPQGNAGKGELSMLNGMRRSPGSDLSDDDGDMTNEELRKLDEDFQKNLQRAQKVFDNRMDNLQRSQIEREAQHQKTLERHQKERAEFERRLQQEAKEQNRRIEQLQREWDRRRESLAKHKRKEEEGSVAADAMSLSSSPPDIGYALQSSMGNEQGTDEQTPPLNHAVSNDSASDAGR